MRRILCRRVTIVSSILGKRRTTENYITGIKISQVFSQYDEFIPWYKAWYNQGYLV